MTFVRPCVATFLILGLAASSGCQRALAPTSPTAVVPKATLAFHPTPSGSLIGKAVDISVSFVEFQYSPGTRWFYAPQIHVDAGADSSQTLTSFGFSIPGLGPSVRYCGSVPLPPGMEFDLFGELYGDYEFTIDETGHRATGSSGTATIGLRDPKGVETSVEVSGPIVPGHLPTTYTGGTGRGWEWCG
jgi:hypothetical protein